MTQRLLTSLSPKRIIGPILTAVGVLVPLIFILWYFHVRWVLVDKPVRLVPGRVSVEFTPNFEGHYISGIHVQRKLPFETMQCLLGEKNYIPVAQCKDVPLVLRFKWQLISNGNVMQQGTSDKQLLGAYGNDFIEMEFLYFEAKRGQRYGLDVELTKDGSELAATDPRLMVEVESWDSQDTAMGIGWAVLFGAVCAGPGIKLYLRAKRRDLAG